ncbi:MAG: FtsQ-type POTRA domain-containing protein [Desulfotomaculaceae bacterium]|nr:FtsQ-type POTRA domain-containing protein [Desulfotomaculaceae bacterium]MDD4766429.1 FtsQ-type POTRA domain-containing protein [Desulfotomaculaceae bacterium]
MAGPFKGRIRQKKWNVMESVVFVIIVLAAGFILLSSPVFEVRQVLVQGNYFLSEEKILDVADIGLDVNIFKLKMADVKSNLKQLPMIKDTQVTRSLPSSVVITVAERVPLGLLPAAEGFIQVDEESIYLARAGAGTPGLPVITGVEVEPAGPGQVLSSERLSSALNVIKDLPAGFTANLTEIHVDEDGQIIIYTTEGYQCRLGLPQEIQEKGEILQQVLLELRKQGAKINYIDLSYAGQPVVYYKKYAN